MVLLHHLVNGKGHYSSFNEVSLLSPQCASQEGQCSYVTRLEGRKGLHGSFE